MKTLTLVVFLIVQSIASINAQPSLQVGVPTCGTTSPNPVTLNIGGTLFMTTISTLVQDPNTILATKVNSERSGPDGSYFFDRDPTHFRYILNYLRTGVVYEPDSELEKRQLLLEAKYYNVSEIVRQLDRFSTLLPPNSKYRSVLASWLQEAGTTSGKWELIYKGTRDGFEASSFHQSCDNKGPTITLVKSNGGCIFGGYSDISWGSSSGYQAGSRNSFLFVFVSSGLGTTPFRALLYQNFHRAIYTNSQYGPTFGGGFDLHISSESNKNSGSYVNWGHSYELPKGYTHGTTGRNWICGYKFQVSEIEVLAQADK